MADITPQRTGEFIRVVFDLLWYKPEGMPAREILEQIPKAIPLTEYEKGYFPSTPNFPRYQVIIRFALIPLAKAGWLAKKRNRWYLTDDGRQACKRFKSAEDFYQEAARLFNEWRLTRPVIFLTAEEAEEKSWEQIQGYLQGMKPNEFRDLVGDLLRALNYHVVWIAPPGKERGSVDIIAYTDPLGVGAPRIIVQVKHKGQAMTIEGIRAFLSGLGPNDVGVLVSSGGFTVDARAEAGNQAGQRMTLIDLEHFFDLWIENYEKLTQDARERFPLRPIFFLSPTDQ